MWKRPTIIPSIDDVKCFSLKCGCTATLICGQPFDAFTLIHRYKIPKKLVESLAWCNKPGTDWCSKQPTGLGQLSLTHMMDIYKGLQNGSIPPDPVKSIQIFVTLNKGQVDGD